MGKPRTASTRRSLSKSSTSKGAAGTKARVNPAPVTYTWRGRSVEVTRPLKRDGGRQPAWADVAPACRRAQSHASAREVGSPIGSMRPPGQRRWCSRWRRSRSVVMPVCTTREPTRKRYRKVALRDVATMVESMVLPGGAGNFGRGVRGSERGGAARKARSTTTGAGGGAKVTSNGGGYERLELDGWLTFDDRPVGDGGIGPARRVEAQGRCYRCWGSIAGLRRKHGLCTHIECLVCGASADGDEAQREVARMLRDAAANVPLARSGRGSKYSGRARFVVKLLKGDIHWAADANAYTARGWPLVALSAVRARSSNCRPCRCVYASNRSPCGRR